jgi:4-hydroxy-2-oxoglutarate aldolase
MLNSKALGGIIGPLATTFGPSGDALDLSAYTANIRAYLRAGLAGVLVAGSTGEAPLLSEDERAAIEEAAREVVPPDRWLLSGVGAESTRLTVDRARGAASRGVDAVLVVAPHYYPEVATPDALLRHYLQVADASPIPVLLYNIPKYVRFSLPPAVVHRLAEHPNVLGMKDSAGDPAMLVAYLEAQSSKFTVLTGHGGTLQAALAAGARGGILAIALIAPSRVLALVDAVGAGRTTESAEIQAQLLPLARDIVGALGPAGIKAALDAAGFVGGPVRSPLRPLDTAVRRRVDDLIAGCRLSAVDSRSSAPAGIR